MSVRKFNQLAASLPDTVVLAISKDLPFAHARFCTVEGIENLVPLSDFRHSDFDENYGVLMADGPLQGLLARSSWSSTGKARSSIRNSFPKSRRNPTTTAPSKRQRGPESVRKTRRPASFLGCRPAVSNLLLHRTELLFRRPRNGDSASRQAAPRRAYPGRFRASDRLRPDRKSTRKRCIYTFSWLRRLNRYRPVGHLLPVDQIPPVLHELAAPVTVIDIIGVFPNVDRQQRFQSPASSGCRRWFRHDHQLAGRLLCEPVPP